MEPTRVTLRFRGGALATLGYCLLYILLGACVIPAAWGAVPLFDWWARNTDRSDGGRIVFEGRAGQIWALYAALIFLSLMPQGVQTLVRGHKEGGVVMVAMLVLLPLVAALQLAISRWIVASVRLTPGGRAVLAASYGGYLGWMAIVTASLCTIILWPWAVTAMLRWLCGRVRGEGYAAEFVGTGFGLLWRFVVWTLGFLVIVPIPWVLRSSFAWMTENTVLVLDPATE